LRPALDAPVDDRLDRRGTRFPNIDDHPGKSVSSESVENRNIRWWGAVRAGALLRSGTRSEGIPQQSLPRNAARFRLEKPMEAQFSWRRPERISRLTSLSKIQPSERWRARRGCLLGVLRRSDRRKYLHSEYRNTEESGVRGWGCRRRIGYWVASAVRRGSGRGQQHLRENVTGWGGGAIGSWITLLSPPCALSSLTIRLPLIARR